MDLQRIDMLRVRAADGLATADELAELDAEGVVVDDWVALRAQVVAALATPAHPDLSSGALADAVLAEVGAGDSVVARRELRAALAAPPAPDVADDVLRALALDGFGLDDVAVGPDLRAALDPGQAPEVAGSVLAQLGLTDGRCGADIDAAVRAGAGDSPELGDAVLGQIGHADELELGSLLRDALDPGVAPDVSAGVMAALGVSAALPVGAALAADAGASPDLWSDVAAAIGASETQPETHSVPASMAVQPPLAPVVALPSRSRLPWVAAMVAAAAAALFAVGQMSSPDADPFIYELAAVNQVEIQDISVADDAVVQVMQFEDDAPTIIFIDVSAEPLPADGDEGATL